MSALAKNTENTSKIAKKTTYCKPKEY